MDQKQIGAWIEAGEAVFGLELGSTRIKAVLIGENGAPLASGSFDWENRLENGVWTYRLEDVWHGIQESYKNLAAAVREKYGVELKRLKGLGFSAMMHGYLAFDRGGALLVPFRTWRNTMTEAAAADLTRRFGFNIPQRWSIAHLHQAILNGELHVKDIAASACSASVTPRACSRSTAKRTLTTPGCSRNSTRCTRTRATRGRSARFCPQCARPARRPAR